MPHQVHVKEGADTLRSFQFRPPDPGFASPEMLKRARALLKEFDPGLEAWWSESRGCDDPVTPGRWRIMQWGNKAQNWYHILYWEYADGSFRPLEPVSAITRKLESIRVPVDVQDKKADKINEQVKATTQAEIKDITQQFSEGAAQRGQGIQHVFGAGTKIRKRSEVLAPKIDGEYVKTLKKRGHTQYGYGKP
jgi:hypothetical protein